MLRGEPALPASYQKAERTISELIDSCLEDLQQLKSRHQEHIRLHVSGCRKQEALRRKLLGR